MRHLIILALSLSYCGAQVTLHRPDPEGKMNFLEMAAYHNYPTEEHKILTDDGYILTVYRIQATEIKQRKLTVFWQHGLMDSAAGGLCNDQARAPIYMLADQGYDVWVGNSRGNLYSRAHKTLDPKQKEFWNFSFGDMALYDLPAVLGYVRQQTGNKIHYIGHSQGTTQMFAALSLGVKGVGENIITFNALAPVAFLTKQKQLQRLSAIKQLPLLLKVLGIHELGSTWLNEEGGRLMCAMFDGDCQLLIDLLMNLDSGMDNIERSDVIFSHFLAGTSVTNLLHWRQLVLTKDFVQMDGTPYNLSNIKANVNMFVGTEDLLGHLEDAHTIQSKLVNANVWFKEYRLGHSSFLMGLDMSYMKDLFQLIEHTQ